MMAFIDAHREAYGVESICRVLPIAPSTYYTHKGREADPEKRPPRHRQDEALKDEIDRIWNENFGVYGVLKVWESLKREGWQVARCTVSRLMRELGFRGAIRGAKTKTTRPAPGHTPTPEDRVQRDFSADRPDALWVSDLTYVATWQGFAYTAFVIDVFSRMIVGWRVSRSLRSDLALDALEQAVQARIGRHAAGLIHHSDRGVQYLSMRYTKRLAEAGIEPSVGSVGDSYDNALAESVIGLYKTEVVHRGGPWRNAEDVEFATLTWVDWFNNRRLMGVLGYVTPAEFEQHYYLQAQGSAMAA